MNNFETLMAITIISIVSTSCTSTPNVDHNSAKINANKPFSLSQLAGIQTYCAETAKDSQLLSRYNSSFIHGRARIQLPESVKGSWPRMINVREQHGIVQGIWLAWGQNGGGGTDRGVIATALNLPFLNDPNDKHEVELLDFKSVHYWSSPFSNVNYVHLTCGGEGQREFCESLYFECVEYSE